MDAPSSSMASTLTTGTGFNSVAARPPSRSIPGGDGPATEEAGKAHAGREYRRAPSPPQTIVIAATEAQPLTPYSVLGLSDLLRLSPETRGYGDGVDMLDILRRQAGRFQCPKCGESLADCQLEMVAHQDDQSLVKVTCAHCQDVRGIAVAIAAEVETAPVIEVRDQSVDDLGAPITTDDVLDARLGPAGYGGESPRPLR